MAYSLLRPLLFSLDAETAHNFTIGSLSRLGRCGAARLCSLSPTVSRVQVMGLDFPNAVGLAAGLDKNGEAIDGLSALGFGFLEIGTVTPRPQAGNPKPRLFRLPEANAIINRMGFNNAGVDQLVANVKASQFARGGGILGINIGKNATTPIERAESDYLACLEKVYPHASYVTVNISSPNTKNLRQLQDDAALNALLGALKGAQARLADQHGRYVPLALKIAPDLDDPQIDTITRQLREHRFDAVIATNTTVCRDAVRHLPHGEETGGLSGAPVFEASTAVVAALAARLVGEIPIIAAGGILNGENARAKIAAGASLVQIYSGLIYRGPALVGEVAQALA